MKLCRQCSLVISKTVNEKGWRQAKSEQEAGMMEVYRQAGGMHMRAGGLQKTARKQAEVSRRQA